MRYIWPLLSLSLVVVAADAQVAIQWELVEGQWFYMKTEFDRRPFDRVATHIRIPRLDDIMLFRSSVAYSTRVDGSWNDGTVSGIDLGFGRHLS